MVRTQWPFLALCLMTVGTRSPAQEGLAPVTASDSRTLLFLDDEEILYRSGIRRQLHSPEKHPQNPLVTADDPRCQVSYASVHRDARTGQYQLWYQVYRGEGAVAYAESPDGVHWTRPRLDQVQVRGISEPNVVLTSEGHYGAAVLVDAASADPERRYKMVYWSLPDVVGPPAHPQDKRGPDGGMYVAFSSDGKRWTKRPGRVLAGAYGRSQRPPLTTEKYPWGEPGSVSDVLDVTFDPLRKLFVVYSKAWIDAPDGKIFWKRAIARTESRDFEQWTLPRIVMAPDELDGLHPERFPGARTGVQLHGAPVFFRHGLYLALLQVADFETHGQQPIELAISRDGVRWSRPFRQQPFLPVGRPGSFDAGRIWSNASPVITDDEMHFYYGAYEHPWQFGQADYPWDNRQRIPKSGLGRASLPLDRLAGLRPIARLGQITLQPRSLKGYSRLLVNGDASGGSIRVELLTAGGRRLPGFTQDDAVPMQGNHLRHSVGWRGTELSQVPEGDVMIRLHLEQAELFSLTLVQ